MKPTILSFVSPLLALVLSPLMVGVIVKTKALFAGRRGAPVLKMYYDLFKLVHKGVVYSLTSTSIFRIGPLIGFAAVLIATLFVPLGKIASSVNFTGDIILFLYLFGVQRFFLISGALDTGSAFEGMGASREAFFSLLAEPVVFMCLAVLVRGTGQFSLSSICIGPSIYQLIPVLMIALSFFAVLLTENARMPIDDPTTHLELTMIHEVMVLDHSGPEFGVILYASAIKLWIFCSLFVQILVPFRAFSTGTGIALAIAGIFVCAIMIGVIESVMARMKLLKIPQLLMGAGGLALLGYLFTLWEGVL